MNVGLVGYGYWGKKIGRNISQSESLNLYSVADIDQFALDEARRTFPTIESTLSYQELVNNPLLDMVFIASPVNTHFKIAKYALQNQKHVLIEKPMTNNYTQARELVELARENKRSLMIDYTFLYSGAIRKLKEVVNKNEIGKIKTINSSRLSDGIERGDVNVFWDLASHDISISNYLLNKKPIAVKASSQGESRDNIQNIWSMEVHYPDGVKANFECSWHSPNKVRRFEIHGENISLEFDDTLSENKIKILGQENVYLVYDEKEALSCLIEDFRKSVVDKKAEISDGNFGLDVIRTLEGAEESIRLKGSLIKL